MTTKEELLQFNKSFPGADAKIIVNTINSYVSGDVIEYKQIIVPSTDDNFVYDISI